MDSIPYSEETITVISKAIMNSFYYKDWLFCGVGFIPEKYRDSIAIAADYMLEILFIESYSSDQAAL
jgi:hypothetical protein